MCARPGTIWVAVMIAGIHGMSRLHVCVDCIVLPSGSVILIGVSVGVTLITGALGRQKCPVVPESEMPCIGAISMVALLLCAAKTCFARDRLLLLGLVTGRAPAWPCSQCVGTRAILCRLLVRSVGC